VSDDRRAVLGAFAYGRRRRIRCLPVTGRSEWGALPWWKKAYVIAHVGLGLATLLIAWHWRRSE
jgi:hypothetical protein